MNDEERRAVTALLSYLPHCTVAGCRNWGAVPLPRHFCCYDHMSRRSSGEAGWQEAADTVRALLEQEIAT